MITPAGPADEETARTGSETRPRLNGQRRRHHSVRQSPAPPIASTTSSGPWSPWRALVRPVVAPNTAARRNRALSTVQSRRERRAGDGSSASGAVSLLRSGRRRVMPISVGRVSAAEQPTEVDACTYFGSPGDSTCARLPVPGWPANRVIRDRTRPQRTGESHAHPRCARNRPVPLGGDWLLARPGRRRRLRRREGVDALVPE